VCSEKMAAPVKKSFCVLESAKYAKDPPTDKTVRAWYKQFTDTGCLCQQKSSGRPLTAEDDVERVRDSFLHSPKKSTELQLRSYRCRQKLCGGFCVLVSSFLVINVCNHGEHYATPCITLQFTSHAITVKCIALSVKLTY
jgi:hypothetical protein